MKKELDKWDQNEASGEELKIAQALNKQVGYS